jgi:hypothetical protein
MTVIPSPGIGLEQMASGENIINMAAGESKNKSLLQAVRIELRMVEIPTIQKTRRLAADLNNVVRAETRQCLIYIFNLTIISD